MAQSLISNLQRQSSNRVAQDRNLTRIEDMPDQKQKRPSKNDDMGGAVGAALSVFLADSYVLLTKTQACHWNATGPNFFALHTLTEAQYNEIFAAIDILAERLRALSVRAPGGLGEILSMATLEDGIGKVSTQQAAELLAEANSAMAQHANEVAAQAEEGEDAGTHDLLVARAIAHDKAAWLLRSHLN